MPGVPGAGEGQGDGQGEGAGEDAALEEDVDGVVKDEQRRLSLRQRCDSPSPASPTAGAVPVAPRRAG